MEAHTQDSKPHGSATEFAPQYRVRIFDSSLIPFPSCRFARARQLSWASHLRRVLSELEREADEHRSPPLPREPARTGSAPPPPPSMPAPPSPPPVPSVPASKRSHPSPPQPQLQKDAVAELIKKNQDVFDKIIDHPFPQALGNATASLDGFRYYMIVSSLSVCM